MQQVPVHYGFTLNELLQLERWLFGGLGLARDLSVYYILFSFVCSLMDFEQIGCEIFISCSLLDCQFMVLAVSFTNTSTSSQFEENQGQDWTMGSQSSRWCSQVNSLGSLLGKDVAQMPLLLLSCYFLFLCKWKIYIFQSCQSGIYNKQ